MKKTYLFLYFVIFLIITTACNESRENYKSNKKNNMPAIFDPVMLSCYRIAWLHNQEMKLPNDLGGINYTGVVEYALIIKGDTSNFEIKLLALYLESQTDKKMYFYTNDYLSNYIIKFKTFLKTYKDSIKVIKENDKDTCKYEYIQTNFFVNSPSGKVMDRFYEYVMSKTDVSKKDSIH